LVARNIDRRFDAGKGRTLEITTCFFKKLAGAFRLPGKNLWGKTETADATQGSSLRYVKKYH